MLPFTAEVLRASTAQFNTDLWPLHVLGLLLALAVPVLTLKPMPGAGRVIGGILAAASFGVGALFYLGHFATLAFFAPALGWLWIAQGALLLWSGVVRDTLAPRRPQTPADWFGLAIVTLGVLWPVVDVLVTPAGWEAVRVFGLLGAPTLLVTLGALLLTADRPPLHLAALPLLWALAQAAMAWVLDIRLDLALPVIAVAAVGAMVWRRQK